MPRTAVPVTLPTAHCSTTGGHIPCSWTAGVNLYPGDSDSFWHRDTDPIVRRLVGGDGFDEVTIDVPISAANFTDAHVQMPPAGEHETYACVRQGRSPGSETYYSPTPYQIKGIARTALRSDPRAMVVVRPMLALGGSCDPTDYYPTGSYRGSGYPHHSNAQAFAHFYTAILMRLAADATAVGHSGHIVLDDASGLSCLFDDPDSAGYRSYLTDLPGTIASRYPHLPQMFSLAWDFADSSDAQCGWSGSIAKPRSFNEAARDRQFLSEVGLTGIDENFPLVSTAHANVNSVAALYDRWLSATAAVAGGPSQTAAGLVQLLHDATGREVVLSAIGFADCTLNPGYEPWAPPADCNRKLADGRQAQPSRAQLDAQQHAVTAAYCYWTQADGGGSTWFLGLWWWDRDLDSSPYVNPYDITWGAARYGSSALTVIRDWQQGRGGCPEVDD